ncbi:uncharacterized protein G2W53_033012 [Senna tora]|uniref:Uncharacterized protein n=1 Tax=Senna tora TaxID=362788 RepID=A0A834SYF9_9FABA|nr:uncharacterized protein G2W53_033012 [Senna tora]
MGSPLRVTQQQPRGHRDTQML